MKKQRNSTTEEVNDVLAIIAGQFLVVALKGDKKSLAMFRDGYVAHCHKLLGDESSLALENRTLMACRTFITAMASRYGWDANATNDLSAAVEDACRAWLAEDHSSSAIEKLRVIDIWSGVTSCTAKNSVIPLSLLDYTLMALIPIVCASEISNTVAAISKVSAHDADLLMGVDTALGKCVSRMCCGIELGGAIENELKLAILLHLPKDDGRIAAIEGLVYKMLQRQYANMEVK